MVRMVWCNKCYSMIMKDEMHNCESRIKYIQNVYRLREEDFNRLKKDLDNPGEPNERLKRLLQTKPLWEGQDE